MRNTFDRALVALARRIPSSVGRALARRPALRSLARRLESRVRHDLDEACNQAQEILNEGRFEEAATAWGNVIDRFGVTAPPRAYVRLAAALRMLGELHRAEELLDEAREAFARDLAVAVEWAQSSMITEDWDGAISRWELVLSQFPQAPDKAYARLAIAYRELGRLGTAAAVLEWGRARHPDSETLDFEWAQLAMVEGDWVEAIQRWQYVLSTHEGARPKAHARLAACQREIGDYKTAARTIERGHASYPDDLDLSIEWAQLAQAEHREAEAIHRWESVLERFGDGLSAKIFYRLVTEYRHHGQIDRARAVVRVARERFPGDLMIARYWAELAMVEQDWEQALHRWERVVDLSDERNLEVSLPKRADALDWHEGAWITLARQWPDQLPVSANAVLAVAKVLVDVDARPEAATVLRRGLTEHPQHPRLRNAAALNDLMLAKPAPGAATTDAEAARALRLATGGGPDTGSLDWFELSEEMTTALSTFATGAESSMPRLHRIRIPRRSSAEFAIRAGRFYDASAIGWRIRQLSERESWPERGDGPNPLIQKARRIADEYGQRYEILPYLPAADLSDAVFFLIYSELFVYEPAHRLARAIVEEADDRPVYIEIPRGLFPYLHGYGDSPFGSFYLYFELRRMGANAFLCQFLDASEKATSRAPMVFPPSQSLMQAVRPTSQPATHRHRAGIIPAGIRSLEQVVEDTPESLLFSSGFLTQKFAYDLSFRKWVAIKPQASIHPPRALLPRLSFSMWPATALAADPLVGDDTALPESRPDLPRTAPVEVSRPLDGDLLGWMNHILHEYLIDLSRRSHAEVALRGIEEAHVCDHLFAESAVFAGAVRAAGGRVVLWPHSANPAHHDVRRPGSFDVVHAVTRTGCEQWQKAFPEAEVVHTSSVMLPPPRREMTIDPDQPLSVIVLGGKAVLGSMPFLDQQGHEASVRSFFQGIERLQAHHDIDLLYKPKGRFGENEHWLESIVGDTAGWQRILEHPLRVDLPNMIFVSIGIGTSALLEGLSRGIPCLMVRDLPVRDYSTIRPNAAVPIGSTPDMLEVIASCASGGLADLAERQRAYYISETDPSDHYLV